MLSILLWVAAYICLIAALVLFLRKAKTETPFIEPPTRVVCNGHIYMNGMTEDGYRSIRID